MMTFTLDDQQEAEYKHWVKNTTARIAARISAARIWEPAAGLTYSHLFRCLLELSCMSAVPAAQNLI